MVVDYGFWHKYLKLKDIKLLTSLELEIIVKKGLFISISN